MASTPNWLRLQKIIFTRYVEQRLKEGGHKKEIKDVVEEMKTGDLLIDLIVAMSGKEYPHKRIPAKMRIQQIQNVGQALDFVKSTGVDLSKIRVQSEDIVDGNEQSVLALIFQIILKFMKIDEGDDDGKGASLDVKEALHLWLNNKTAGYAHIAIKDFTKSFHDGMVFLALIHRMRPKLVDYAVRDPASKDANLELALNLGEKYLNIPKYIQATDIPNLNEVSMIVYLSDWFSGVTLLQKQDIAARRIGKLVDLTELHDKLRAEYTAKATSIHAWLAAKTTELKDRTFDDTLQGIKDRLAAFYAYKKTDKAAKSNDKLDAQALFDNLAARLVNHKRPAWVPATGLAPQELDAQFVALEEEETKRSDALNAEHARQIHLLKLFRRFHASAQKLKAWFGTQETALAELPTINSVEDAESALEDLTVFDGELKHLSSSSVADLTKLAEELLKERYEKSDEVKSTQAGIAASLSKTQSLTGAKRAKLEAALQAQKDLNESLYKAFADAINDFGGLLKSKRDALADSKADLDAQLATAQSLSADHSAAEAKLAAVEAADAKLQARELAANPFTNATLGDAQAQLASFTVLVTKKIELLKEQLEERKRGGLTPEQVAEIRNNFAFFDKDSNGFLNKKELRTCLQSLGEESTAADINRIIAEYDKAGAGHLTLAEFELFVRNSLGDSDTDAEIVKSFKYLTFDRPVIQQSELQTVVNNRSFTDHHVEYLVKEMPAGDGGSNFEAWTAAAFAR